MSCVDLSSQSSFSASLLQYYVAPVHTEVTAWVKNAGTSLSPEAADQSNTTEHTDDDVSR